MTGFIDPLEMNSAEAEEAAESDVDPAGQDTLDRVRELVLRAHPEVAPELVRGESLSELLASVEPAQQAYADLAARLHVDSPVTAAQPTIQAPAGGIWTGANGPRPHPDGGEVATRNQGPDQPAASLIGVALVRHLAGTRPATTSCGYRICWPARSLIPRDGHYQMWLAQLLPLPVSSEL